MGLLLWAILSACTFTGVLAQDYSSLTVHVSSTGRASPTWVFVIESGGRTEERELTSPEVQFCDLGGLPVTVKVGEDWDCNQVVVRNDHVTFGRPYALTVTYNSTRCNEDLPRPPVPICQVVFRVADSRGWVQGARIRVLRPEPSELQTDRFGRASVVMKLGDELGGSVTTGGLSRDFTFRCTRDEPVHEERIAINAP